MGNRRFQSHLDGLSRWTVTQSGLYLLVCSLMRMPVSSPVALDAIRCQDAGSVAHMRDLIPSPLPVPNPSYPEAMVFPFRWPSASTQLAQLPR